MAQSNRQHYRPEIDGLRAFAVVSVIINHFGKDLLPSGYLGVDIFFVISGFVITASLSKHESKNFSDFLVGFYRRRVKRLIPALVVFVFITSVLICLFNPSPNTSLNTGITSLFGLSNLYLLRQSTDYFAPSTELNVFTHTWSLGVEEQFYFLFPFLVWFTGFGRLTNEGAKKLFWVTGILSIASLIIFVTFYQNNQPAAYFLMPTRFWELGTGCLLFLGLKQPNRFLSALAHSSPLLIISTMVGVLFVPVEFAVQATIAVVLLTSLLLICLRSGTTTYALLTYPPIVYIGLVSYSLYLWHWGILSLSRWTIGIHWWSIPFQVTLILLVSIISYRYVETPFRRSEWSTVPWRSIAYGVGASASVAILLSVLIRIPNLSFYTGRQPSMIAVGVSSLSTPYRLKATHSLWKGEECILSGNSQVGKKIAIEDCTLGNFFNSKKRVMVLGNSFSAAFIEAFDDLVTVDGYSVTVIPAWGASPVKEVPNTTNWKQANEYYWNNLVPDLINQLKPDDWVFLMSDLAEFSPKQNTDGTKELLSQLEYGLRSFSNQLAAKSIRLAVLHGIPLAREANCQPVAAAKQWFSPFGGPCKLPTREVSLIRRDNLNKVLSSLEAERKLRVVDIFDIFCSQEQCTYNAKNGQFLYRDEFSHPSVEAARLASPVIRKALISLKN